MNVVFIVCLEKSPLLLVYFHSFFSFCSLRFIFSLSIRIILVVFVVGRSAPSFIQYTYLICLCFVRYFLCLYAYRILCRYTQSFSWMKKEKSIFLHPVSNCLLVITYCSIYCLFYFYWQMKPSLKLMCWLLSMFNYTKHSIVVEITVNMINYQKCSCGNHKGQTLDSNIPSTQTNWLLYFDYVWLFH